MRKLFNKPWFVAVLAIVALCLVGRSVISSLFAGRAASAVALSTPEPEAQAVAGPVAAVAGTPVTIESVLSQHPAAAPARDPFGVPVRTEATLAEKVALPDLIDTVHLSAIWTQDGATLVLLNDQIMELGEQIGRLKVEKANEEGVWVSHWKGRDFIALGTSFTLKTPARQAAAL
jgi:hypothetical protein